jgi:predicted N-acyltransferase
VSDRSPSGPSKQPVGYTFRILERVSDVRAAEWDAMLTEDSSPFVEYAWLDAIEDTGCVGPETGWIAAHLTGWRGSKLVMAAPSYVKGNSEGEFVFDWGWADLADRMGLSYYPKIVVAVPFTPASGARVLVAPDEDRGHAIGMMASAARQWCQKVGASGVHVLFPRAEEADAWEASGYLRREGYQFHWHRDGAATFDEYLARFNSKQRNQIKREVRSIESAGIDVRTLQPEEHSVKVARAMHAFYASTIERHGVWGRMYLNERFFERVVECFRDRLAWVVAKDRRSGTIVGGAFNVACGSRLYGRYWGADVAVPFLHFAVCYYAGIRHCLERGLNVFEPGAGGEHKRARGFVPTITRSAHWLADARLRSILAPWLARERLRVAEIVGDA